MNTDRQAIVLVVEDEPMIRSLVTWILRRNGYAVLEATDGQAGLDTFDKNHDIDVVLSDIVMPKLDGVHMVRALRERNPTLPVLFMSAYTGHDQPEIEDTDLRWMLSKPFTPQQLVDRVEQLLASVA